MPSTIWDSRSGNLVDVKHAEAGQPKLKPLGGNRAIAQKLGTVTRQAALQNKPAVERGSRSKLAVVHTGAAPMMCMPGMSVDSAAGATAFASGTCYAMYMGRALRSFLSCVAIVPLRVGVGTPTWAEVALATGAFNPHGAPTLTMQGFTDVSGSWTAMADVAATITITGRVRAGDDLWLVLGSNATTPYQPYAALPDRSRSGIYCNRAVRPSLLSAQVMTLAGATDVPPLAYLYVNW